MEVMQNIDRAKTGLQTWLHALQTHTEKSSSRFSSWFSRTGKGYFFIRMTFVFSYVPIKHTVRLAFRLNFSSYVRYV